MFSYHRLEDCVVRHGLAVALLALPFGASGDPPTWWSSPPPDDAAFMFAAGEGLDQAMATKAALLALAGRLETSVQGEIRERATQVNGVTGASVDQRSRSSVAATTLSNYTVKHQSQGGRTFALVQLDRRALLARWGLELGEIRKVIDGCLAEDTHDRFLHWRSCRAAVGAAEKADQLVLRMLALDPDATINRELLQQQVLQRTEAIGRAIRFRVDSNHPALQRAIRGQLEADGVQLRDCARECDVTLAVDVDSSIERSGSITEATYRLHGRVLTPSGEVGQKDWVAHGSSWTDEQGARAAADQDTARLIKEAGLWTFLGIATP